MSNENDYSRYQPQGSQTPESAPAPQPQPSAPQGAGASRPTPQQPEPKKPLRQISSRMQNVDSKKMIYILTGVAAAAIIIAAILFLVFHSKDVNNQKIARQQALQIEQLEMEKEEMRLNNEYAQLNSQFAQVENQSILLANDSIVEKYAAAKAKVEKLLQELNQEKTKNRARIKQLEGELATLKNILKEYVERIDQLTKENESLKKENADVKRQNSQLSANLTQATRSNQELTDRITLAEKLNVTGVNLSSLKKNDKIEKNITKAKRLMVTFTLPPNNSTPVGEKTIYLRIVNPEGDLLPGNGIRFSFEGQSLDCTAAKTIEYAGEEIGGIRIYWDVTSVLTPGDYTVELFADNFRIYTGHFMMKK
ncbi:MAG: hypothetical protein HDS75_08425 [Bacteroidales bacterium]|nr:hypothetical protein [Bacteroidales bacterium]MDE6831118.1 hypothetical protein [Muribaculaceae bacterium]